MNQVMETIQSRRSTRSFTQVPIPQRDLEQILEAGQYAPSGMNRQSWQFTVLRKANTIEALASAMRPILHRGSEYDFYRPSTLVLLSNERDNDNGQADCACALQTMFLMAESLNIGSCWINQLKGICDETPIRALLDRFGIPQNHVVWGMAALGYVLEPTAVKPRRDGVVVYAE